MNYIKEYCLWGRLISCGEIRHRHIKLSFVFIKTLIPPKENRLQKSSLLSPSKIFGKNFEKWKQRL